MIFPDDFAGEINLVFIAFLRWHQDLIDEWVPFVAELAEEIPALHYYEFPTLPNKGFFYRTFLNEGMRAMALFTGLQLDRADRGPTDAAAVDDQLGVLARPVERPRSDRLDRRCRRSDRLRGLDFTVLLSSSCSGRRGGTHHAGANCAMGHDRKKQGKCGSEDQGLSRPRSFASRV